jgi:hypothetical protein
MHRDKSQAMNANLSTARPEKERERFYLLPGMGGRALKRKRRMMLHWSLAAGVFVSAIVAFILYWMSRQ